MNALVRPFAARVIAADDADSSTSGNGNANAITGTNTTSNGLPAVGTAAPTAGGAAAASSLFTRNVSAAPFRSPCWGGKGGGMGRRAVVFGEGGACEWQCFFVSSKGG